jgi:hypothetical protein
MFIAAFIFVLSLAALIQFVGLQWRAGLVRVASTSMVSDSGPQTVLASNLLRANTLSDVLALQKLCPDLGESAPKLQSVRLYNLGLELFAKMGSSDWAKREMDLYARYATVVLMQQVQRNQAFAAQASSF